MGSNPGTVYWKDIFSHIFVVKICNVCLKRPTINIKEAGVGPFFLKSSLIAQRLSNGSGQATRIHQLYFIKRSSLLRAGKNSWENEFLYYETVSSKPSRLNWPTAQAVFEVLGIKSILRSPILRTQNFQFEAIIIFDAFDAKT